MAQTFKAGQLVRIIDARSLAYGRIAMIMTAKGKGRSLVRFADLPKTVVASDNPASFTDTFANSELSSIEDIPLAAFYLVVTIAESNGEQSYTELCLARGDAGQDPEQLANAIAQRWYESGGDWDEDEGAYVFDADCRLTAAVDDWEEISLGQYANLRSWLKDCTPDSSL